MVKLQKRIRLKDFNYRGCYRYYLTIDTNYKTKYFTNSETFRQIRDILKNLSEEYRFDVWIYSFMPDHLHSLVEGKKKNSDFKKFVTMFKQKSSFSFKRRSGKKLWQENYYEHVLRNDEDTMEVVKYILNNPARAGLVNNYYDYSFSGSFVLKNIKYLF